MTFEQVKILEFEVSDTGFGIDEKDIPNLFKMFRMANQLKSTYNWRGTGIGLTISKKLVESLGGNISLTSQIGIGTEVTFTVRNHKPSQENFEEIKNIDPIYSIYNEFTSQVDNSISNSEYQCHQVHVFQVHQCDLSIRPKS